MPEWVEGVEVYRLKVDESRLLRLTSEQAIHTFTEKYRAKIDDLPVWMAGTRSISSMHIEWPKVAAEYGGIEIAPYQWSCRLDPDVSWYYGWDVASGCIWDASLITAIHTSTPA
jgi:hypothetical protein